MSQLEDIQRGPVLALCGGIGGAKLALGLYHVLPPDKLTVAINTGDDFEHLGLHISPDIDTVLYTLAGLSDPERGWGRADESWNFLSTLKSLGGDVWFQLGDRDLALHVMRTRALRGGEPLSTFTRDVARRLGIAADLIPMSDEPVRTLVDTTEGLLPFQHYFVARRCEPVVKRILFDGSEHARPARTLLDDLQHPDLRAIVICPSNPYLSVDPILAVPGIRQVLNNAHAPVIAVSPVIGGAAVKGPTAKIMGELGLTVNSETIAAHYAGLIDGLVIDQADAAEARHLDVPTLVTATLMKSLEDRTRLAADVLQFAARIFDAQTCGQSRTSSAGGRH